MRNFGVPNWSNRAADGGIQQPGPLLGDAGQAPNSNIIQFPSGRAFLPDSRTQECEPFLLTVDVREIGALFVFAAVVLTPWIVVAGGVALYLHFAT